MTAADAPSGPVLLPVRWYRQKYDFTCGPAALLMALRWFDPGWRPSRALELEIWREATLIFMTSGIGGCGPMGLAGAAAARGLAARVVMKRRATPFVTSVRTAAKRRVIEQCHRALRRRARALGVRTVYSDFGVRSVRAFLDAGALPIVLVDLWHRRGRREPHWVLVTGYDDGHVYLHDPWVDAGESAAHGRHVRVPDDDFRRMKRYGSDVQKSMVVVAPRSLEAALDRRLRLVRRLGPHVRTPPRRPRTGG